MDNPLVKIHQGKEELRPLIKLRTIDTELIDKLIRHIMLLEQEIDFRDSESAITFSWFYDNPLLIRSFVEYVYGWDELPDNFKRIVEAFHDESVDLSTIPCTGNDFTPWP